VQHPPDRSVAVITDIRRSGPGLRRRTIVIDGDPWRDVPAPVVAALALAVSDAVDRDELEDRIAEVEPPLARERALRLITARERSRAGLAARLVEGGFTESVAADTVADFVRIGLVDDERFAHALARTLANARGIGRSGIMRELRLAGVEDEAAAAALEEALGEEGELAAAARLAAGAAGKPGATVDRVTARLVRRGYRLPLAIAAAREAIDSAAAAAFDDPDAPVPFDD
jgi:regulatory protein